jgi:hypothetical protein
MPVQNEHLILFDRGTSRILPLALTLNLRTWKSRRGGALESDSQSSGDSPLEKLDNESVPGPGPET